MYFYIKFAIGKNWKHPKKRQKYDEFEDERQSLCGGGEDSAGTILRQEEGDGAVGASMMMLDPIALTEYTKFATELFAEKGKRLHQDVVEHVYRIFDGNTFYLQKTFNLVFSKTADGGECGVASADDSIEEMLASYDIIYREILAGVGESQKQLLIAVAKEGDATSITSAKFIKRNALPSASSVQAATKRLLASNLLTRTASTYRLQDPLLRLWLLQTY